MDILDKLKSQIGDDVQHIFDHEALFKAARDEITALRSRVAELEADLRAALLIARYETDVAQDAIDEVKRLEAALAAIQEDKT